LCDTQALFTGVLAELGMEIEFKILGPLEILAGGRRGATISPQLWCVLVSLLMSPNVSVSIEVLIDRVWDDNPPPKARSTIRSYIWRIDRALSQVADDTVHMRRQAHGYALEVDPQVVDLHRFHSLRRQSDSLAESGEIRHAAVLLQEAEALWRGPALAGLPGAWIGRTRDSLGEELRSAAARRIDLELTLGRHAQLLAELGELSGRYPMDEVLAGHRMIALFRSGRQADALRVYRETRARLTAEGIEPSPSLARLHERILRHDSELAITPVYRRANREPQPNTLPADIEDFVGRAEEIRQLTQEHVPKSPLWIIEGMGGVGKTALAIHVGHLMTARYPDAQLHLSLRANDQVREPLDASDALRDLLAMLDVPTGRIPGSLREQAALWRAELSSRRALIIFDDVTGPEQVRPLLPEAGDCLVIVTSRRRHPDWGDARSLTLRVFPEDDAVSLFAQIAGRGVSHEPEDVAEVARLCGFLPLAIRLAASHLRATSVSRVLDLIEELHEPNAGHGKADNVNQRIQATFALSYRQLTASEQRFFRYLGVSPCIDISVYSGAAISGVTAAAAEAALGTLSSHHLLEEISPGKCGFHDLIRAFAAARFAIEDPEPEARLAVGRLADYYIRVVRHANEIVHEHQAEALAADGHKTQGTPLMSTPAAARAWLESELGNALRVAQYCSRHEWKRRCADLIHALGAFLVADGHWDDALAAHLMALQACRDLDDLPGAARAAFDLSLISLRTGHSEEALQHAAESAATYGALGDKRGQAAALDRAGIIHRNTARFRDALAYHREAMDIYRVSGDRRGLAGALVHSGAALAELGRHEEAMRNFNEALRINCESGDLRGQGITLNNIGVAMYKQGYHKDAMRSWQESLDIFREIGGRQNLTLLDHNMGLLHQYKGNYKAALVLYRRVLATYRSIGDLQHQAHALADIGSVYQIIDQFDEALAHYEKAASLGEVVDDHYVAIRVLCGIADVHFGAGRHSAALENYERAARLSGEIESLYFKGKALNGIAETVLRMRGPGAARIYWREAYDIFAQLGAPEAATVEIRLNAIDTPAS
jgi:DNA-binding SARP family transcriptional activator/tetratricopeptide (TPR) repeat protein